MLKRIIRRDRSRQRTRNNAARLSQDENERGRPKPPLRALAAPDEYMVATILADETAED